MTTHLPQQTSRVMGRGLLVYSIPFVPWKRHIHVVVLGLKYPSCSSTHMRQPGIVIVSVASKYPSPLISVAVGKKTSIVGSLQF